jgi:putative transposase
MHAHLVFDTEDPTQSPPASTPRPQNILRAVCEGFEREPVEFNSETNHVHILMRFPPKVALARLVNRRSSGRLRQEFPTLACHYWRGRPGFTCYFAGSVGGAPPDILRACIDRQNRPT